MSVKVLITRLDPSVPLPSYAKPGDAGADLTTRIDFTLKPGERLLVPTGISIALDRKSTRLNSSHMSESRMPSSA